MRQPGKVTETLSVWVDRFVSAQPKFPHIVILDMFGEEPIYQRIVDIPEFRSLLLSTLINIHNSLGHHNPNVAVTTGVNSDKTRISVTPPKHYLEEEGILQ